MWCRRRLPALLILYMLLDTSNPFMPGVFEFSLRDSVEGLRQERERPAPAAAMVAPVIAPAPAPAPVVTAPGPLPVPRGWLLARRVPVAHARSDSLTSPPGGADDH